MINVKVSMPSHGKNLNFKNFFSKDETPNINFHINTNIDIADFWFVFEDLNIDKDTCKVPKKNVFYFNNETSFPQDYFFQTYLVKYLNQFEKTFGCYANRNADHVNVPPFLPWMIHGNHGDSIYKSTDLNYDFLSKLNIIDKPIDLSVICSNKTITANHSLRLEFVKNLKNYFGDKLIWYGNGVNSLNKKSELIFKSKYHISIENDYRYNLISEKLYDSFLGLSVPIYYGASNVSDYFEKDSVVPINIHNFNESVITIENILKSNFYEENFHSLLKSRDIVLGELNLYRRLCKIVENNQKIDTEDRELVTLYNSFYFWNKYSSNRKKIKKYIKRKLRIR